MKIVFIVCLCMSIAFVLSESSPVKYMEFTSQQQELQMTYIYEKAPTPNNKTVVLLHGKNFSGLYWRRTITSLLEKGYNVLAPDQIGFGQSSMPTSYQYSFQQLAANTKKLIDSLGIRKPILLGHSMGGMLAIRYVLSYPYECSQLVLEDPIGLEDWKQYIPYSSIDGSYNAELKKDKTSLKKYMLENYFHGEWKSEYDTLLELSSANLGRKEYAWSMALTSDMLFTQPVYYEFEKIKVPTVLIIGDRDRTAPGKEKASKAIADKLGNYPELGKAAAARIPNCKLVMMQGLGHIPHIEDFKKFTDSLYTYLQK